MSSAAVKVILGVSVLAMAAGFSACDGGSGSDGPMVVAGSGNGTAGSPTGAGGGGSATAGAPPVGTAGSNGSAAGGGSVEGVPITPMAGWVAKTSNDLGIEGAAFSFADTTSGMGMTDNLMDATATAACIKGVAAKVDMASDKCVNKMFDPPAMDCYGQYWGAALGINLNQTIDMTTMKGGTPMAFDASMIKGFYFEISGETVPGPSALRFKVDDGTKEYCNPAAVKVKVGANTVLFSDLTTECWAPTTTSSKVTPDVQSKLIKISWQVVTNASSTVPFDFCVGNVRALLKDGAVVGGAGGASGAGTAGAASSGTAGAASSSGGASAGAPSGTAGAASSSGGASAGSGGASAGSGG